MFNKKDVLLQRNRAMPRVTYLYHYSTWNFGMIVSVLTISSPACLIVFVKLKTENQLVIPYLVADNNVKRKTVAATRDLRLHHSRPMAS